MSIESILRRKGTDVTTIAPEASIKRAADWLRAKYVTPAVHFDYGRQLRDRCRRQRNSDRA